jgi:tetratricopeptide (TPR) repeat protein
LDFARTARSLSRNPLGIIALFIVLIYGIAGLVFGIASSHLDAVQRWPLIWFLVIFPPLVFAGFIWLVTKHSLKLYAPSDFRDDESFVQLNQKISIIEVRQKAAEVDPRGDSDFAFSALEALLNAAQSDVAKNLANAFLKVRRYDVSLRMFDQIMNRVGDERSKSLLQYRAYSLMGLGRYGEAVQDLEVIRATGNDGLYDFWPRLALAYCHLKLGRNREFEAALGLAVAWHGASEYRNVVGGLYPELVDKFTEGLSHGHDLTGLLCTSRREREFTRRTAGYAKQEVQGGTDRNVATPD